jgi:hypothetical protein
MNTMSARVRAVLRAFGGNDKTPPKAAPLSRVHYATPVPSNANVPTQRNWTSMVLTIAFDFALANTYDNVSHDVSEFSL